MKKSIMVYLLCIYMLATNILQILLLESKGDNFDSFVKTVIIISLILFAIIYSFKKNINISKNDMLFLLVYSLTIILIFITNDLSNSSILSLIPYIYPIVLMFVFLVLFGKEELTEINLVTIMKFMTFYVLYMCIYNFIINYDSIININIVTRSYEMNYASFFNNRNTFAFYLVYGLCCSFSLFNSFNQNKKIYLPIFLFLLLNLILTLSRTGLICVFLFILISVLINSTKKQKMFYFIALLLLVYSLFSLPQISSFFEKNLIRSSSGLSGRNEIWSYGSNLLKDNYLLGLGFNKPIELLSNSYLSTSSFHNTYLTILLYGGILYVIANIFLWLQSITYVLFIKKHNKKIYYIMLGFILIYFVYGFTETQVLFFSSSVSFVSTCFISLISKYINNYYNNYNKLSNEGK